MEDNSRINENNGRLSKTIDILSTTKGTSPDSQGKVGSSRTGTNMGAVDRISRNGTEASIVGMIPS